MPPLFEAESHDFSVGAIPPPLDAISASQSIPPPIDDVLKPSYFGGVPPEIDEGLKFQNILDPRASLAFGFNEYITDDVLAPPLFDQDLGLTTNDYLKQTGQNGEFDGSYPFDQYGMKILANALAWKDNILPPPTLSDLEEDDTGNRIVTPSELQLPPSISELAIRSSSPQLLLNKTQSIENAAQDITIQNKFDDVQTSIAPDIPVANTKMAVVPEDLTSLQGIHPCV